MVFYKDDAMDLKEVELGLWGRYQIDNASLALRATGLLIELEEQRVRRALKNTRWEGRMEIVRKDPLLILDGAHNPDGVARVVKEVKSHLGSLTPVFTALREKEWDLSLTYLRSLSDKLYLVPIKHHRGEDIHKAIYKQKDNPYILPTAFKIIFYHCTPLFPFCL